MYTHPVAKGFPLKPRLYEYHSLRVALVSQPKSRQQVAVGPIWAHLSFHKVKGRAIGLSGERVTFPANEGMGEANSFHPN